ncbi:MAG: hypothetical protein ACI92S_005419, partial [Planctomycetaceae bacterium]
SSVVVRSGKDDPGGNGQESCHILIPVGIVD